MLLKIKVIGHTDNKGFRWYNQQLSIERATQVAEYMIVQGIPRDKIQIEGAGETQPIVSNETEEDRAQNRRVDIIIRHAIKKQTN